MSLKLILLIAVPMFVICCAILLKYWDRLKKPPKQQRGHRKIEKVPETVLSICSDEMSSDNQNEAEAKMAKAIFISADCWLCVFDLLPASQLGHGIAMISHRFDFYVDEHFKTRKWTLKPIQIERTIGENGTKEMEIVNDGGEALPIPQIQLPRKVIGFKRICISFIDKNVIAFLHRFGQLFAVCPINLFIGTKNERILEFILRNIWPMFVKNLHGLALSATFFRRLRQFVDPSILNNFPSLRVFSISIADFFIEFPADDSAAASDGQAMTKWLFTPLQENDVPKVLRCCMHKIGENLAPRIEAIKAAFTYASSSVNFIVVFSFRSSFADTVVPFVLTNELTREQLALKRTEFCEFCTCFLLIRCPIVRDADKWAKWENEANDWRNSFQWNQIFIQIDNEDKVGDGLLDANPGTSDQQQKLMNE